MSVQSGRPSSIYRGLWDHISKAGPIFPSLSLQGRQRDGIGVLFGM